MPFRLAVTSDWGPIIVKSYKPLNDTFDYILAQRQREKQAGSGVDWRISGLLLNGDYAYNLDTDHCQMYLLFFIVNGILTGTGQESPIVWYNNQENLGIRMLTIPVEDTFYGFELVVLNLFFYERLKGRKNASKDA